MVASSVAFLYASSIDRLFRVSKIISFGILLETFLPSSLELHLKPLFFLCSSIYKASIDTMMSTSSFLESFLSKYLFVLTFPLDSARDSWVALAKETTSFLLMGEEVGLGAGYG